MQQPFFEQGNVLRAAVLIANGIDQELKALQPSPAKQIDHHLDYFRIHRWRFRTDGLRANLIELSIPALLRTLAPEHGTDVIELLQAGVLVQTMLDVSAHH